MKWFRRKPEQRPLEGVSAGRARPSSPGQVRAQPKRPDWRTYDAVAEQYARVVAPQFAPIAADVLEITDIGPGVRVLDVGTGTGAVLAAARARGVLAVGVDPSVPMLRAARAADPGFFVAAADTINFPFRTESFDAATANFVLPFFKKLDTALFEIVRVLKPGGRLALSTWERGEDELTKTWREAAERAVGIELLRDALAEAEHWEELAGDRARLEQALRDAGLHPVRISRRQYKLHLSREDYITMKQTGTTGRFVRGMLGEGWDAFIEDVRNAYAARFPEMLVDFRDVLLAVGTKPEPL